MKEKKTVLEKLLGALNLVGNAILMNLLFLVSCIPVVTIGQAWCALFSAVRYNIRGDKWFDGWKVGFKTRFWRGTLSWCAMLLLNAHLLLDLRYAVAETQFIPQIVSSGLVLALTTMVTCALLLLNVYIHTPVGRWINNAVNMVFKAPLQLLGSAVLMWLPVVLALLWEYAFFYTILIYIAVYFAVMALVITMLMKNALIFYLVDARADGVLLSEEGKQKEEEYEDDEEDEDEEAEDDEDAGDEE